MIVTNIDIKEQDRQVWPSINEVWFRDSSYWLVSPDELVEMIAKTTTYLRPYVSNVADCDYFALQLQAEISEMRYDFIRETLPPFKERVKLAFGQASGLMFQGKPENHTLNICNTTDGVYLVDATKNNRIWKAVPDQDKVFFHII